MWVHAEAPGFDALPRQVGDTGLKTSCNVFHTRTGHIPRSHPTQASTILWPAGPGVPHTPVLQDRQVAWPPLPGPQPGTAVPLAVPALALGTWAGKVKGFPSSSCLPTGTT